MFGALVAVAGVYAIGLLVQIQWDLSRYRKQLEAFHTQTISEEDRERYQLRPYKYPFGRGGWFLGALLRVSFDPGGVWCRGSGRRWVGALREVTFTLTLRFIAGETSNPRVAHPAIL